LPIKCPIISCGKWLHDEIVLATHIRENHPGFWEMYGLKLVREAKREVDCSRKKHKKRKKKKRRKK